MRLPCHNCQKRDRSFGTAYLPSSKREPSRSFTDRRPALGIIPVTFWLSSKEDRRSATSPQPQRSKQVSAGRYLSHGNSDLHPARYSSRLVDGLTRPQGCLPPCAYTMYTGLIGGTCALHCGTPQGCSLFTNGRLFHSVLPRHPECSPRSCCLWWLTWISRVT